MVRIHDLTTDEVIDREMNDAEYAEYQAQQEASAEAEAEAAAKEAQRKALLDKLGITAEEAQLLLGGNN
jgi:phosphopantetheinyl transferase (holo-ACP synthase)